MTIGNFFHILSLDRRNAGMCFVYSNFWGQRERRPLPYGGMGRRWEQLSVN